MTMSLNGAPKQDSGKDEAARRLNRVQVGVSMEPRNRIRGRTKGFTGVKQSLNSLNGAPKQDSGKV